MNHRKQHRPVHALCRSFLLLFVGSMCRELHARKDHFQSTSTLEHFRCHESLFTGSWKDDASFVHCPLAPELFFLCISIVNPFVFVVVHAADPRHTKFDWRTPKSLLILQTGDTAHEHVVFPVYGAPDGECDISSVRQSLSRM